VTITTDYKIQGTSQLISMRWGPAASDTCLQQPQQLFFRRLGLYGR
jgi:hypothetical protein